MKKQVLFFILIGLIVLLLDARSLVKTIFSEKNSPQQFVVTQNIEEKSIEEKPFVTLAGKKIRVDLSDTPATRTQGLSGRVTLSLDEGMLFVFEREDRYGFWMKDMNFSIDIAWIDAEKNIVHVEKNISPETYPKVFTPSVPAKYVLEVQAGFFDEQGTKVGDKIEFSQIF